MKRWTGIVAAAAIGVVLAATGAAASGAWKIDPARTHIKFAIDATGWPRTTGEFRTFEGRIAVDFDKPQASRVSFTVSAASVDCGSAGLNGFIAGPALLNAEKFPKVEFTSTAVEKLNDHAVRVTGDLTLLGVTKPLTLEVDVKRSAGKLDFAAHTRIDRLAFGMDSGFPIISRDVDLDIVSGAGES